MADCTGVVPTADGEYHRPASIGGRTGPRDAARLVVGTATAAAPYPPDWPTGVSGAITCPPSTGGA